MKSTIYDIVSISTLFFIQEIFGTVDKPRIERASIRLNQDLKEGYNKYFRPLKDQRQPVTVKFGFALNQLIEVDVKHEKIEALIWQRSVWVDDFLTWDPEEYDNISVVRYDPLDIWLPDVIVQNSVGEFEPIREVTVLPVVVLSNGSVNWYQPLVKTVTCRMNVMYFPYDTQQCHFIVGSWTHNVREIDIDIMSNTVDTKQYIEHNQWDWVSSNAKKEVTMFDNVGRFSYLDYTIVLRRKPQFYEMNLVIPTGLISGLAFVAFLLPSDSGEKVGFGITVFLSLCVNLLIIAEFVPASSKSYPIIGKYYLVCIMMVALSLIITTLVLTLHHHATVKPVPEKIARTFFDFIGPWIGFPSRMLKRRNERNLTQEEIDKEAEDEDNKLSQLIEGVMQQYSSEATGATFNSEDGEDDVTEETEAVAGNGCSGGEKVQEVVNGKTSSHRDPKNSASPNAGTSVKMSNAGMAEVVSQLSKLEKLCEGVMYEKQRERRRNAVIRDWQYLSRIVDRMSAIVFVIATTVVSFSFILAAKWGEPELRSQPFYTK